MGQVHAHRDSAQSWGQNRVWYLKCWVPISLLLLSTMKIPQHPEKSPSLSDPQSCCFLGSSQSSLRQKGTKTLMWSLARGGGWKLRVRVGTCQ